MPCKSALLAWQCFFLRRFGAVTSNLEQYWFYLAAQNGALASLMIKSIEVVMTSNGIDVCLWGDLVGKFNSFLNGPVHTSPSSAKSIDRCISCVDHLPV